MSFATGRLWLQCGFGRTTTVPSADAKGIGALAGATGDLTVGYYANDLVASEAQGTSTMTFTLDAVQNRIASFADGSTTTINHYADAGDSPAWTATGTATTRNVTGPDGNLAATVDGGGAVTLQLANLHGDIVATAADDPNATGVASYAESTEFGAPRSASTAPTTYGWLGDKRRSTDALGGVTLMGVRLYNPTTGRFLSPDPIPDGSANPYLYPTDPINDFDLNGQCWKHFGWACKAYHQAVRLAAVVPYGVYYGGYRMNRWAARHWWAAPIRPTGWAMQLWGITADMGLDYLKSRTGFHESIWDEHHQGSPNPLHRSSASKPTYLPGAYWHRGPRVDWGW